MVDAGGARQVELVVSDPAEFRPLREWLARVPDVEVQQIAGMPIPGEQGAVDILTILASSGGVLAVAIRSIPDFIRSRRSDLTITVKAKGKELTLQASNVDDAVAAIGNLLHE